MANSVEILVHVSAPGTTKEDAKYRAHANAYFEFEAVSRVRIFPDPPCSETGTDEIVDTEHHVRQTTPQGESNAHRIAELNGRNEKDSLYNFLSSGKSTSLPSTWGPSFGETTCGLLELPDISIQRSSSQNDAAAIAENSFSNTSNSFRPLRAGSPDPQTAVPSSQVTETPPSEVPESQASFPASWDVEKDNSPPRRSVQGVQIGRSPLEAKSSESKRRRLSVSVACIPSSIPDSFTPISSTSKPPFPSEPHPQAQPQCYQLSDKPMVGTPTATFERLSSLPLEINPPRPIPSSTAQFTTHITPTLQMLADKLKLSKVFNPPRQIRPLRTLERGYWLLDLTISDSITSSNDQNKNKDKNTNKNAKTTSLDESSNTKLTSNVWTSKSFFDFWDFLSNFIALDGRAGWGVWCICESKSTPPCSKCSPHSQSVVYLTSQEDINSSAETQPFQLEGDFARQVTVKIYTWGEIAPHVYLLMYLASDKNVRNVPGVQWRDGADQPVIFMD
ncbi:hypothetical protein AJ78_02500 [Emergomyces pasteurianus Ep9510]|uniref:Uncharacterized protein n=1 Tax=Emergomyces pasteurianus Ep9510 TaxID=1447872 RepID=A0A1J9PNH3_9EURO|nr:hypothetical protein AJ78_02500 [Emergomyces pasteurianus Ep9510]